ncbi:MAG: alpha-amylase, partial [Gemmatimonadetes bacterium]|nr:alpha-amylase [Gemmatimonadota bacterium]
VATATAAAVSALPRPARTPTQVRQPAWTRGAVCYEVFVRSFYDSDGDGIGDLNGLTSRLDYINDGNPSSRKDLGASCIWLMPVSPSPSYHGYDVTDYYGINKDYGTKADFRRFVAEAHRRGIRVLVDMVLNHTSSENPHFLQALRDTASPYRAWYRFAPKIPGDGKGPWGTPAWHRSPVRDEYYYGIFGRAMPDLNYHTPAVREEAMKIADFWLRDMGVDGLRLDAVQYLVEQGRCLMDCAGTHRFLREYAAHIQRVKPGAYTVGEVWDSLGELLTYYPHQLTSYFMFPLSDSLLTAVRRKTAGGMLAGYLRMQDAEPSWRWSPLLTNHDMPRTVTALYGDTARARVAATLLLTLPGMPFVYYGEEIGMTGDKPDPRLRTPMQWRPGPGGGFTTAAPWESLQPDSMTVNVADEDADPGSLLNLYRRLIHLRKDDDALAAGRLIPLSTGSPHVVAYLRRVGDTGTARRDSTDDVVLVVANLDSMAVTGVTVASARGALEPGAYRARSLLGGADGASLRVGPDGRIVGYVPSATLSPRQTLVLRLVPADPASGNTHPSIPTATVAPIRAPQRGPSR